MANARKYAGSNYVKLDDLHDKPPLRERLAYAKEEEGKFGAKLVLFFESGRKISLNATSVGNLIRDIGQDYDDWTAHDVKVFAGEVDFKHGKADAVLVELIDTDTPPPTSSKTPPETPKKPASKAAAGNDMDDEIPF